MIRAFEETQSFVRVSKRTLMMATHSPAMMAPSGGHLKIQGYYMNYYECWVCLSYNL